MLRSLYIEIKIIQEYHKAAKDLDLLETGKSLFYIIGFINNLIHTVRTMVLSV